MCGRVRSRHLPRGHHRWERQGVGRQVERRRAGGADPVGEGGRAEWGGRCEHRSLRDPMGRVVPGSLRNPSPQPLARDRLRGIHQARPAQLRSRTGMAERHRRGGSSQQPGTEPADDLEAGRRPVGRDGRRRRRSGQRERRRRPATDLQFSRTDRHRRLGETRPRGARRPHRVAPRTWQRDRRQLPGHHRRCVPTRERHVDVGRDRVRCGSPRGAGAPSRDPRRDQAVIASHRPAGRRHRPHGSGYR